MHDGGKYAVVPIWTRQEGRSDLSLEAALHPDQRDGGNRRSSAKVR